MPLRNVLHQVPRTTRMVAGIGVLALVAIVVGAVAAGGQDSSGSYRTAAATIGSVDQVLEAVATIEPVAQATVAFPIAGTVASVDVDAGDDVEVGTELATLDTASLERSLREAQASLDQAELSLERALNGEAVTGSGGGPSSGTVTPTAYDTSSGDGATIELGRVETIAATSGPSDADIASTTPS